MKVCTNQFVKMLIEQVPQIVRRFFKPVLWRKDKNKKVLYLTFDDGPNESVTLGVLNELDRLGIKATFFCIGNNVEKHPELFEEIQKRGHKIGSHGYGHIKGIFHDDESFYEDIKKAEKFIQSNLFRPPHGHITPKQIKHICNDYTIVLWDVITRDYNQKLRPEQVYQIAIKYARNGSIIVFHDSVKAAKNMQYAFPKAVEYWQKEGYKFEVL